MDKIERLIRELPDPAAARRFLDQFEEKHAAASAKLRKKEALLSDAVTLAAFSPLLATTMLQHPEHLAWLEKRRVDSGVRSTDELIESLAQFSLTNSTLEPQILFARFRRRELLRIYLRDIRRLATIAEITEEISNLADAILDSALKLAHREMDNRFGPPQETDDKGRTLPARFCIAALGKLGSRELNYSSDIDLLFIYSNEGSTTGKGSRGQVTNREYFVKLAEYIVRLVGQQAGEGAAYRVDLRLRPHGTMGALALSVGDTVRYCTVEARAWERQVLIRSRGCAGDVELYKEFFADIENLVYSKKETVESALANVRRSKERIDLEQLSRRGYNVKLGRGGIREIEFIAQALQLAYGGRDKWLRSPHTLISLSRLADRKHLSDPELTELAAAYEFLRRTEHILQMENGLQTHTVPDEPEKRGLLARRMTFAGGGVFEVDLNTHVANVSRTFARVFGEVVESEALADDVSEIPNATDRTRSYVLASIEKSEFEFEATGEHAVVFERLTDVSPYFATVLAANPQLASELPDPDADFIEPDYAVEMMDAVESERDFGARLSAMRRTWVRFLLNIVVRDIFEKLTIREIKRLQTNLAEASIAAALRVVRDELARRYHTSNLELDLAMMALGKLGGRGLDYDSDLDLIIVYYDPKRPIAGVSAAEFYSRVVELFTTVLSSMTRDGNLYRVDLRLRPFGSKGMSAISIDTFLGYMAETASIWEMLAFVKLRFAGGDPSIGFNVEHETRRIIHERAVAADIGELKEETRRVRLALEQQRTNNRRGSDIDIKYGSGGMLDVYFAMRYLQLRHNIPDAEADRSTPTMLTRLAEHPALHSQIPALNSLAEGYAFLATLDHNLRLTVGRTTRVPLANQHALTTIAVRMHLDSPAGLLESLTAHRLVIRDAFEHILAN
jgi:glutamate-ammonia-ligase adenylyltransferase